MSFPDIMICSTDMNFRRNNLTDIDGLNIVLSNIKIENEALPMYRKLCGTHSWLTIYSTQERRVDVVLDDSKYFQIELLPQPNLPADWIARIFLVPNSFAAWGGWFSVVWGVFYILFGAPRLDPFGLVALCFMTNKAKRKILKAYGPLPRQPPSTHGPDVDPSRRMSIASDTSMSSFANDPIMHDQMSPIAPGDYSKMATQNNPHQTQRMVDQRFRRLERMLSEFYLNMPTDDLQEEEEEGKRGWFWRRGRRGLSPAESGKSGDEYYGVDLRGNDPYHDQIPLRGYDPRTMAREE
ncbi:hypothetical protein BG006_002352 [Podila minutissima]|uniref:Uncharacterized protein n=1 Tax=Podila minutissima TaxID=64525 RepID=A0A9P5VNT3_9FUNG|nr:hypothetical protein BG006_002352 [Podila minutissima]